MEEHQPCKVCCALGPQANSWLLVPTALPLNMSNDVRRIIVSYLDFSVVFKLWPTRNNPDPLKVLVNKRKRDE